MTQTIDDLTVERARYLNQVDDILNTARENNVEPSAMELRDLEYANRRADELAEQISRARTAAGARSDILPNPIGGYEIAEASRSLDALFWATNDVVRAGKISANGAKFLPDPNGATNTVERAVIGYGPNGSPVHAPRLAEYGDRAGVVRSFQELVAEMQIFGALIDRSVKSGGEGFEVARAHAIYRDRWQHICRAMDVDTSGEGGAWVPTGIGGSVHEKVRAMGKVAPLFARIDMPSNPWKWPVEGSDAVAYRVGEPVSDTESKFTASTPGTVAPTFDAEIFGSRVLISRSVDADSAVAVVPFVQNKLARAHATAEERAILDGDTDGTHMDSDVGASTTDARTAWDGLRKRGLAQTASAQTTTTAAKLALIRKDMGKWGLDPAECAYIMGVQSYHALLADTNVVTLDKMGPHATIPAGQLASVNGIPVVVSEHIREDLNASGVHDGIVTNKTWYCCVNRSEWALGQRMALEIETDDSVYRETFQRLLIAFQRLDLQSLADTVTNDETAVAYNCASGS